MTDIQTTTVSKEGFVTTNEIGDAEVTIDATGETAPTANAVLVSTYAACFLPAFRVGGRQRGQDELGKVQIDAEGDLDDDDDLEAIRFRIHVEADLDDETFEAIVARAEDICHVHAALRPELQADISVVGGAF